MRKKIIGIIALLAGLPQLLAQLPNQLKVGDTAPSFSALDQNAKEWKLSDYKGKKMVVVFFYPAAMTPGCTKQACSFRDDKKVLADMGVEVIGISGDNPMGLMNFTKAHQLNFTLLSDFDGKIADSFGVPNNKGVQKITRKVEGKDEVLTRGVTARRWTFLIDKEGKIAHVNKRVNAAKDSENILKVAKGLAKK